MKRKVKQRKEKYRNHSHIVLLASHSNCCDNMVSGDHQDTWVTFTLDTVCVCICFFSLLFFQLTMKNKHSTTNISLVTVLLPSPLFFSYIIFFAVLRINLHCHTSALLQSHDFPTFIFNFTMEITSTRILCEICMFKWFNKRKWTLSTHHRHKDIWCDHLNRKVFSIFPTIWSFGCLLLRHSGAINFW